ncbi:MAG: hypothetical protein Q8S75_14690 [Nitrospirota bacterium]|nr:hypothetical protein [Nitrospirota bacterium]
MESAREISRGVCVGAVREDGDFETDVDMAGVTIGVPSVRDAGWANERELVRADPLRALFLVDAGGQLREGTGGGDVTREGFCERLALDRSGDLEEGGFCE